MKIKFMAVCCGSRKKTIVLFIMFFLFNLCSAQHVDGAQNAIYIIENNRNDAARYYDPALLQNRSWSLEHLCDIPGACEDICKRIPAACFPTTLLLKCDNPPTITDIEPHNDPDIGGGYCDFGKVFIIDGENFSEDVSKNKILIWSSNDDEEPIEIDPISANPYMLKAIAPNNILEGDYLVTVARYRDDGGYECDSWNSYKMAFGGPKTPVMRYIRDKESNGIRPGSTAVIEINNDYFGTEPLSVRYDGNHIENLRPDWSSTIFEIEIPKNTDLSVHTVQVCAGGQCSEEYPIRVIDDLSIDLWKTIYTDDSRIDKDNDHLVDDKENALADYFKPYLIFDSAEGSRRSFEPMVLFQVHPLDRGHLRLKWGYLFLRDGGYGPTNKCMNDHWGDNPNNYFELLSLDDGITWKLTRIVVGEKDGKTIEWPANSNVEFWPPHIAGAHNPIIYLSAHKHHMYLNINWNHEDSFYSDPHWLGIPLEDCNEDVDGEGVNFIAEITRSLGSTKSFNNVGEYGAENHTAGFINCLYEFPSYVSEDMIHEVNGGDDGLLEFKGDAECDGGYFSAWGTEHFYSDETSPMESLWDKWV